MRHATLRQLRVFTAAAKHLSFARAAAELHLTAPAVSLQIAELERHAGTPLFDRLGSRLHLTQAGEAMLRASRQIVDQLARLEEDLAALNGIEGGTLNVGAIHAGDYFLAALLARFCARHHQVRAALVACRGGAELVEKLESEAVDLAVMNRPPQKGGFSAFAFAAHPFVLVASPRHPLAGMRRIPLEALANEPFVAREAGTVTRELMDELLHRARLRPQIALETPSNETIKQAVAAGFGIAFISAHAIGYEIESRKLAVLDVLGLPERREWFCVHLRGKRLPAVAQAFSQYLQRDGAAAIRRLVPKALRPYWDDPR